MKIPTVRNYARGLVLATLGVCMTLAVKSKASVSIENSDVQIGGFFSQGYLYSDNNNFPTKDVGGTWNFREAGFNVSDTIGAHLRVGAQIFEQSFGNIGEDKVILDWAIADYNFASWFGIRAGRVKYPKGLYGEALDLDVVRPFIFLPGAIYNPILRDFIASFDGAMVYGSVNVFKGSIDYKVFGGNLPAIGPSKGVAEFYNNAGFYAGSVGSISTKSVEGAQLTWNTPLNGLKFVASYSFFTDLASDGPFAGYPAADLKSNFNRFSYTTFSAEYTTGNWVFASEWQRQGGFITYGAPPFLPQVGGTSRWDGWYVSAARRLNDKFEVGAYYGSLYDDFTSGPGPGGYQRDGALSLRYDLNDHVLFKIEAHDIDGTYELFNTARIPNPKPKGDNLVIAAKTTLSF